MPADIPGYTYVGDVQVDELCGFFDDPDSPLNDWLSDAGVDYSAKSIGCATITVGGLAAGGLAGSAVAGAVCADSVLGCVLNDAIRNATPCGRQYVEVYVASSPETVSTNKVLLSVRCEYDVIDDVEAVANDIGNELQSLADAAYDISVTASREIADEHNDAIDAAEDVVDDIIDWGSGIF